MSGVDGLKETSLPKEASPRKTTILLMNDTDKPMKIRQQVDGCPSTIKEVQPQKLVAFFMQSDEIFIKIWNGEVMLIKDGVFGGCAIKK